MKVVDSEKEKKNYRNIFIYEDHKKKVYRKINLHICKVNFFLYTDWCVYMWMNRSLLRFNIDKFRSEEKKIHI